MASIRCKVTGHDPDACGVCKRCGDDSGQQHDWREAERAKPCFRRSVCERCAAEREQPDHDWEVAGAIGADVAMQCSRCGMRI